MNNSRIEIMKLSIWRIIIAVLILLIYLSLFFTEYNYKNDFSYTNKNLESFQYLYSKYDKKIPIMYYKIINSNLLLQKYFTEYKENKLQIIFLRNQALNQINFNYYCSYSFLFYLNKNKNMITINLEQLNNSEYDNKFKSRNPYILIKYLPNKWKAKIPFTLEYELSDYDPIENYEYGYENYSKLYRYRIKLTRIDRPMQEKYIIGNENWDDCPVWPEPSPESVPQVSYRTDNIVQQITIPDSGVYNITIEAKDNENLTNTESINILISPCEIELGYRYFYAASITIFTGIVLFYTIYIPFKDKKHLIRIKSNIYIMEISYLCSIILICFLIYLSVFQLTGDLLNLYNFISGISYLLAAVGLIIAMDKITRKIITKKTQS